MPRPFALSTFTEYAETVNMKGQLLNVHKTIKKQRVGNKILLFEPSHTADIS